MGNFQVVLTQSKYKLGVLFCDDHRDTFAEDDEYTIPKNVYMPVLYDVPKAICNSLRENFVVFPNHINS